jgi:hypothetical protein
MRKQEYNKNPWEGLAHTPPRRISRLEAATVVIGLFLAGAGVGSMITTSIILDDGWLPAAYRTNQQ